jgi:protein-tyrosine phosphatase
VHDNLYVGGAIAILSRASPRVAWWAALDLHGVRHPEGFRREAAFSTVDVFLRRSFDDGEPIPEGLLNAVAALIQRRRGPVLISCAAGVSRSASVAYAILRDETGIGHDEALRAVSCKNGRPHHRTLESARRWADHRANQRLFGPGDAGHGPLVMP